MGERFHECVPFDLWLAANQGEIGLMLIVPGSGADIAGAEENDHHAARGARFFRNATAPRTRRKADPTKPANAVLVAESLLARVKRARDHFAKGGDSSKLAEEIRVLTAAKEDLEQLGVSHMTEQ